MTARLSILLLSVVAAGCKSTSKNDMIDRPSIAVSSAAPQGGGPMSAGGVLSIFASARCEREAACGLLGENPAKADRETCERDALKAHAEDVTLLECKTQLDVAKVEACADNLRAVSCNRDAPPAADLCGGKGKLCMRGN